MGSLKTMKSTNNLVLKSFKYTIDDEMMSLVLWSMKWSRGGLEIKDDSNFTNFITKKLVTALLEHINNFIVKIGMCKISRNS